MYLITAACQLSCSNRYLPPILLICVGCSPYVDSCYLSLPLDNWCVKQYSVQVGNQFPGEHDTRIISNLPISSMNN